MAELIRMPKLGFDMQEGQLVKWLKESGESVSSGEVIAEIETDKATVEVESFQDGTILDLLVEEGTSVPVGKPIAVIGEEGEEYQIEDLMGAEEQVEGEMQEVGVKPGVKGQTSAEGEAPRRRIEGELRAAKEPGAGGEDGRGLPGGMRVSPLARRIAEENDLDLRNISGSGPEGRIIQKDVEKYLKTQAAGRVGRPAIPFQEVPIQLGDEEIATPRMRARIGQRMAESKQTIPHFYVTNEIDMGPALNLREELNKRRDPEEKISINDLIVKAAALSLRNFPNLNSTYQGETMIRHGHIHIGIAVAVEGGLLNVVSRDADLTPVTLMATRHKEMIARARDGKVKPEDIEGATFTLSNLGAYEVDHFIAIINPPQTAILAFGTAVRVPVVNDQGEIEVGWRMKSTISADHRVTDGAEAAEFMQHFKEVLEDPFRLLM
jgi:pyruvate dehydrogenase E2 component (dihydrolipoamide acetyltransferase)